MVVSLASGPGSGQRSNTSNSDKASPARLVCRCRERRQQTQHLGQVSVARAQGGPPDGSGRTDYSIQFFASKRRSGDSVPFGAGSEYCASPPRSAATADWIPASASVDPDDLLLGKQIALQPSISPQLTEATRILTNFWSSGDSR